MVNSTWIGDHCIRGIVQVKGSEHGSMRCDSMFSAKKGHIAKDLEE